MKKALNIVSPILTVIVLILGCSCANKNDSCPDYCKDIYKSLTKTTGLFRCSHIKYDEQDDSVHFYFEANKDAEYSKETETDDVIKKRKIITNYLYKNPKNELSSKHIILLFSRFPGDSFNLNNFNEKKEGLYNDFPFCYDVTVNASNYESFINVFSLSIKIESSEELKILEKFERLEYLKLYGPEISDDERDYLRTTLPDCEIYYNGKLINKRVGS